MASFASIDRRVSSGVRDLHDYLWTGRRLDQAKLQRRLGAGAKALDAYVRARGAISRAVLPLLEEVEPRAVGADLFTFLSVAGEVAAAAEFERRAPKKAAQRASGLAVSLCIHLASAADRFDLVEAFESGKTDFADFTSSLADVLEQRGVVRAGQFRRAVNGAFDVNALWDPHDSPDVQRVAARSAVSSVAFASCLLVDAMRTLGRYRDPPYGRLSAAVARILDRTRGHP